MRAEDLTFRRLRMWLTGAYAFFVLFLLAISIAHSSFFFSSMPGNGLAQMQELTISRVTQQLLVLFPFLLISAWAFYLFSGRVLAPYRRNLQFLSQFTQDAGHELSAPVSVLRSRLQIMEIELAGNETEGKNIAVLMKAVKRADNLIKDLRILSETTRPDRHLSLSFIRLNDVVSDTISEVSSSFEAKKMTLSAEVVEPVTVVGDADAISRALINLLNNALKYVQRGGTVTVEVKNYAGKGMVAVEDNGPGIPQESVPHLFDRFFRVESSETNRAGGSGLGLAIVKAIVDAHQGTINVSSEEGSGTRFEMMFPCTPSRHPYLDVLTKKR